MSQNKQRAFTTSALTIAKWLTKNKFNAASIIPSSKPSLTLLDFGANKHKTGEFINIVVDRLSDSEGVSGDVTDIRVQFYLQNSVNQVNISLKHMHEALKHPRLTRVPQWIGIENRARKEKYLVDYANIWDSFINQGKKILTGVERFNELKAIDSNFIENNLYKPFYHLVMDFLTTNCKESQQAEMLFDFLVGKNDFIKFIDKKTKIEVQDFCAIPRPKTVAVSHHVSGYLDFEFDNGWKLSGRLHNASGRIATRSIKFDIQATNLEEVIPAIYLPKDSTQLNF